MFLLIVRHGAPHEILVARQVGGQTLDAFLFFPAAQHFFLQRNVHAHIRRAGCLLRIVEWEEKRIAEENPVESLGIEIGRHHGAIRQANVYVQLVQNAVEIRGAAGLFRGLLLVRQPFARVPAVKSLYG